MKGGDAVSSGFRRRRSSRKESCVNPVPTFPAYRSPPPGARTPRSKAPRSDRDARGSVKPPITNSCRAVHFVFNQAPALPEV